MTQSPFPDLTLPAQTILMNMLNTINASTLPRPLTAADCVFGDPRPYGGQTANTMIPFGTTDPATFGAGTVTVRYARIDIGKVMSANQSDLPTGATKKSDLLADLNAAYGLNLAADDIIDGTIDTGSTPTVVTIHCKTTSLIYTGVAVLQYGGEAADAVLGDTITHTTLNGLNSPVAP